MKRKIKIAKLKVKSIVIKTKNTVKNNYKTWTWIG